MNDVDAIIEDVELLAALRSRMQASRSARCSPEGRWSGVPRLLRAAVDDVFAEAVLLCGRYLVNTEVIILTMRPLMSPAAELRDDPRVEGGTAGSTSDGFRSSPCPSERVNRTYGAPRVHAELRARGQRHSRKRVARLLRQAGRAGRAPKRWRTTTVPDPAATVPPDLIRRDFSCTATDIDTRWCGDITYIHTWEGWLHLATVIDIASRRVVGWATADHLRTDLVAQALDNAVRQRRPRPGVIFHADRGCQYTSARFGALAEDLGVRPSVGRKGQCRDNAVSESFFATIKTELLDRRTWSTRTMAHKAIFEYIEGWYNTRRLHSSLGYLSPAIYEATRHHPLEQVA
ncbi:IS3 family transposase [Saccharothrix syringae]|uniref:IS3 family transposase n=1 Tax=Saccharothrix syringae TaxID=103733 RepID=UPI00147707B8|nr:IS3 family transposase [Saccharothrix syringae]